MVATSTYLCIDSNDHILKVINRWNDNEDKYSNFWVKALPGSKYRFRVVVVKPMALWPSSAERYLVCRWYRGWWMVSMGCAGGTV